MCRCKERAAALVRTVQAVRTGDTETVAKELAFVATSSAQDVAAITTSALRSATIAARARLNMRRR